MLFYAGKAVQFLIAPLNIVIVLLLLALLLHRRKPRTGRVCLMTGIGILWAASAPLAAHLLLAGLESQYPILASEELPSADCIVLLGGTVYPVDAPRVEPEELSGSRVLMAARLYHAGKARRILCAGGVPYDTPAGRRNEAQDMRDVLIDMRIPKSAIQLEEESRNTNENAIHAARILRDEDIRSILLVTSAFHMPRAMALFEREGLNVIAAPSDVRAAGTPWKPKNLLPSPEALKLTTWSLNEYVGFWGYRLLGKL